MNENAQHLLSWTEWGRQWIAYLRGKPELVKGMGRDLGRFENAFADLGRKAAALNGETAEYDLARLTARAEEINTQFQRLLKLVRERQENARSREDATPAATRQEGAVVRPVPIGGHKLPPLPYAYDALEPYIDAETMRIHHDILHQNYVNGLNNAETMMARARATNDFDLIRHWEREAAFNGAGHYLHTIFWQVMSPEGGGLPQGELARQIIRDFGSFEAFQRQFSQAAERVEGPGWALLVWSPRAQHLEILTAEKHQNLTQWESIPLLVLDVWEHAYFLSYRSDRSKYIDAWWKIVNWPYVQNRYLQARQLRWQPF